MSSSRCKVSPGIRHWMIALPLCSLTALVAAQAPNEQSAEAASERRVIEEVIVTATKRAESSREIPASIIALMGDELEQAGAQGLTDIIKMTPGVTLTDDGQNARSVTIRGVARDAGTTLTTGVLFGDVPLVDPYLPRVTMDPNPFDLATVEVLKGPQGTLFGGSALNGAIRYVPNQPDFENFGAKLFAHREDVETGGTGRVFGAAFNLPLGDTVALRLVGQSRRSAGWIDEYQLGEDDVNATEQDGFRLMARWQPIDRLELSAMKMRQHTFLPELSLSREPNDANGQARSDSPRRSPTTKLFELLTLGINYDFDSFSVLSQSTRTRKFYDNFVDVSRGVAGDNPPPALAADFDNESEGYMQELRFTSSGDGPWTWIGGLFWQQLALFEIMNIIAGEGAPLAALTGLPGLGNVSDDEGNVLAARFSPDVEVRELALFGEVQREIFGWIELSLGLRAYKIESGGTVTSSGPLALSGSLPSGETETVNDATVEEKGLSPKFTAEFFVNDKVKIYTGVSRGFRFGGPQLLGDTVTTDVPEVYKSDSIWNYELGLRSQWLDNTLLADGTLFYLDWDQPQIYQVDETLINAYIDNIGRARSKGMELALQYLPPIDGLTLTYSAAYTDTVAKADFTTQQGTEVKPGHRWPLTPKFQSSSSVSWQGSAGPWRGGVTLSHSYTGKAFHDLNHTNEIFGYENYDLQLFISNLAMPGAPNIALNVSNLKNRQAQTGVNANNTGTYTRPRTVTLRIATEF